MTLTRLAAVSALAAMMAAPALAQPPQQTPEQREARFVAADANKDNKLDQAEWKASLPPQMLERIGDQLDAAFGRRDTDGDKFISKAEFLAPMQRPQ